MADKKPIVIPDNAAMALDPQTASVGGHVVVHHMAPGTEFAFAGNPENKLIVSGQFENGGLMLVHGTHGRGPDKFWSFAGWDEAGPLMLQQGRQAAASIAEDFRKGVIHDLR